MSEAGSTSEARTARGGTSRAGGRRARPLALLAGAGALAAVTLLGSQSASADSSTNITGGGASYQSYGEIFTVHDYSADGYAVVGYLYGPNGGLHTCLNTNGEAGAAKVCNYSFAEGSEVEWQVCRRKSGVDYNCSAWRVDYS
ncbi:hypothetical protein [Streptomyces sp. NPDC021020]|uniref:hypothetical protein n=1 Tax=Streptomyces sp. NPDC021020 TaxID=3365109 RepID=UPI00379D64E0